MQRELSEAKHPETLYEAARSESEAFVKEHWPEIVRLAESLLETESLGEEAVELVFDPTWPEFREMLDELADDIRLGSSWRTGTRRCSTAAPRT